MLQCDITGHPRWCGLRCGTLADTDGGCSPGLYRGFGTVQPCTQLSLRALFHLFLPKMDPLHTLLFRQPSPLARSPSRFQINDI